MNDQQLWDFLGEGTRTAHVAAVRRDGRPHVKPVWFVLDGEPGNFRLCFNTGESTVTGRALARDPRLAVTVDDPQPPYGFALLEGRAELIDDLDQVRDFATRIGARYMGIARAEEFGTRNGVPGELLVSLRPDSVAGALDLAE